MNFVVTTNQMSLILQVTRGRCPIGALNFPGHGTSHQRAEQAPSTTLRFRVPWKILRAKRAEELFFYCVRRRRFFVERGEWGELWLPRRIFLRTHREGRDRRKWEIMAPIPLA